MLIVNEGARIITTWSTMIIISFSFFSKARPTGLEGLRLALVFVVCCYCGQGVAEPSSNCSHSPKTGPHFFVIEMWGFSLLTTRTADNERAILSRNEHKNTLYWRGFVEGAPGTARSQAAPSPPEFEHTLPRE